MDVTTNNTKSKVNIRLLVGTGMLSGLAFVLQYLEFPIPIMPGFIKFDFSDLPALIGAFAYGPLAGVIVEFIKNLLHCTVTQSFTVGELSNFILSCCLVIPAGIIGRKINTYKGAVIGCVVGSIVMALLSIVSNYFLVYPIYENIMPIEAIINMYKEINPNVNGLLECLIVFNCPFTLIKGLVASVLCMPLYKVLIIQLND